MGREEIQGGGEIYPQPINCFQSKRVWDILNINCGGVLRSHLYLKTTIPAFIFQRLEEHSSGHRPLLYNVLRLEWEIQ